MMIESITIVKSDERGIMYDCGKVKFLVRKKGSISGDHTHNEPETLFMTRGKVELTVGEDVQIVEAPAKITIPGNVHHKLVALTDIELIEDK